VVALHDAHAQAALRRTLAPALGARARPLRLLERVTRLARRHRRLRRPRRVAARRRLRRALRLLRELEHRMLVVAVDRDLGYGWG